MAMAVNRMTVDKAWDERHLKAIEDTNRHMIIRIPAKVANHTVLNIILWQVFCQVSGETEQKVSKCLYSIQVFSSLVSMMKRNEFCSVAVVSDDEMI